MTRDLGAHPIALSRLLDDIANGAILLPEFQRTFDWSDKDIRSLLATALMSWPAGSLLLMSGKPDFALRSLEGGPPKAARVEYVILDGQQRLTSLFHALRGAGEDVWILQASKLPSAANDISVDDLEEAIKPMAGTQWASEYPLRRQAVERMIPLHSLESPADYFEWRDAVTDEAPAGDRKELRKRLTGLYKDLLSRVHEYSFPSVILDAGLPIEAIARIFERINRTGQRLTTFDLMVARTYQSGWNLRSEWEAAQGEFPLLSDFLDDGLPAIHVVSMVTEGDIRQPAVLQLDPDVVRESFWRACESLAQGYEWLVEHCGLRDRSWVPYGVMPVVAGAVAWEGLLDTQRTELERWFWLSVLSQRYDVGSSTQAVADYCALREREPMTFPSFQEGVLTLAPGPMTEATRRKMGPLWRGFACALGTNQLLDLRTGESLLDPQTRLLGSRVSLASVFPRTDAVAGGSPYHLRVLSQFAGHQGTLKELAGDPSAWTSQLLEEALASQIMPMGTELERLLIDPEAFLTWRLQRLAEFVESRSDVRVQTI